MIPVKVKKHPAGRPRGVRDSRTCSVQAGAALAWVEDGQPMLWTNRPLKFHGAMRVRVQWFRDHGRSVEFTDIKWKQLGSDTWWRLPDYPKRHHMIRCLTLGRSWLTMREANPTRTHTLGGVIVTQDLNKTNEAELRDASIDLWAALRKSDDDNEMSLRPRAGETSSDVLDRVTRAAKAAR